jgi:hypothetical protein
MTISPLQLVERFMERDNNAISEMNNWMHGPITESRRLEFLEGRVQDLCGVAVSLCKYIDQLEKRLQNEASNSQ